MASALDQNRIRTMIAGSSYKRVVIQGDFLIIEKRTSSVLQSYEYSLINPKDEHTCSR